MRNNFDFGVMASTQKKLLDHYNWVVGTQSMAHWGLLRNDDVNSECINLLSNYYII